MNNSKFKTSCLLVFSCTTLLAGIGYSNWIIQAQKYFDINGEDETLGPVAYIVGKESTIYTSLKKALDVAVSGEIVCLVPPKMDNYHAANNATVPDRITYNVNEDCIIKDGVTLVIPTDKSSFSSVVDASTLSTFIDSMRKDNTSRNRGEKTTNTYDYKASYGNYATDYSDNRYLRVTLNICSGKKLINNGTLIISGYLSGGASSGGGKRGQTSHSYSQITLEDGAILEQNSSNAVTHCYGYIKETSNNNGSKIIFKLGNVYMPLIIADYRGFTILNGIEPAVKEKGCSPFNQLEIRNIGCDCYFYSGISLWGISNIFVYQSAYIITINEMVYNQFKLIGNTTDALINLTRGSAYLLAKFTTSNKINLKFYGGATIGNLAFNATVSGNTMDLNTSYGYFPISYQYEIELNSLPNEDSSIYDSTKQKIKFLPGSTLILNSGCSYKGDSINIYSAFVDGNNGQSSFSSWNNGYAYPLKDGAVFEVLDNATLSMNSIGGVIYSDQKNNISCSNDNVVTMEPWNINAKNTPFYTKDYLEIHEIKNIVPISYINKKKIYAGINAFNLSGVSYVPSYKVLANDLSQEFIGNQGVAYLDKTATNISIEPISNLSSLKYNLQNSSFNYPKMLLYEYKNSSSLPYFTNSSNNNILLCAIGSDLNISNDNDGVNEFDVQSISIESVTPKLSDGRDSLFVNNSIQLKANVINESKRYDKNIIWSSSNDSVATVDQNGNVSGVSLGSVIIYATCGNLTAEYSTAVIEKAETIIIESAYIVDSNSASNSSNNDLKLYSNGKDVDRFNIPNSDGVVESGKGPWYYQVEYKYSDSTDRTFILNYSPNNASIKKITWHFYHGEREDLKDYSGNIVSKSANTNYSELQGQKNSDGNYYAVVNFNGYTNADPDGCLLRCIIDYTDTSISSVVVDLRILHNSGVDICVLEGTLLSLFDGTLKKVEELTFDDDLLVFDHFNGCFSKSKLFFNYHANENNIVTDNILTLYFDNGNKIRIYGDHGFFDLSSECYGYQYINIKNCNKFIGHSFVFVDDNKRINVTKLINYEINFETVRVYSPVTIDHMNIVSNSLLSITGEVQGWFNFFDYDGLKYNEEKMRNDIEKYGLYEYEQFKDYISLTIYNLLPIRYLKISVRKNKTDLPSIIKVMKKYAPKKYM